MAFSLFILFSVNRRDTALIAAALALFGGAAFFVTAPARRTSYLRRAPLPALEQEARTRPADGALWLALGQKRREAGKLPEAYEALARAAELGPHDFAAWSGAAELAQTLYGEQGAFDLLDTFVKNNPDEARAHLALARLYFLKSSYDRAVAEAKLTLKTDPKLAEAWRIIGWERLLNDARQDAENAMRKAVEIDPADFRNHVGLGDVYSLQTRYPEAVATYRKALSLSPSDANAQRMLARAQLKSGVKDPAGLAEIEKLLRQSIGQEEGRGITHIALAELFERRGEWAPALQEYESATLLEPNTPDTLYRLSQLSQQRNRPDQARQWATRHRAMRSFIPVEKILKQKFQQATTDAEKNRLRLELAQKTAAAGLLKDAVEQLQALPGQEAALQKIEQIPLFREQSLLSQPGATLIAQGDARLKAGDLPGAQALYFAAVRRNRFQAVALQNVGLVLLAQGKSREALPFLSDALTNDPTLSRAHFALGDLAHAGGDGGRARGHYEAGLKTEPKNVAAWLRLGAICRDGQQESPAHAAFEKAYALAPELPECAREWASTLEDDGKHADAESVLRKSLEKSPESETLAQLAVLRLEKFQDLKEADALLAKSLKADPQNTYAQYGLGLVRLAQKRPAEARALLETLVLRDPKAREIWFALGRARRDAGDATGSQKALDTARRLEQQFIQEHSKP